MKLSNIFKKETASASSANKKTNVQPLDKKQLEKVIGGGDGTVVPDTVEGRGPRKSGSVILCD